MHQVVFPGVSLRCSSPVAVAAGDTASLNCSIDSTNGEFIGEKYLWREVPRKDITRGTKYDFEWDNRTYVSLTISNVLEEKNYTVDIMGRATGLSSGSIQVLVNTRGEPVTRNPSTKLETSIPLCIFIAVIALGILCFVAFLWRKFHLNKRYQEVEDGGDQIGGEPCSLYTYIYNYIL
ncbi:hypothetical protein EYF80_041464 [Liparis tanakae]|uniref:Immunoglobulin domain-containing protein n=1 Tax=Liparis tanakae TaxID=230148 RepID=A0A4Z2G453_9TELE|nr:hypothetical protein EYF80_041464 [Liparis tanakae]